MVPSSNSCDQLSLERIEERVDHRPSQGSPSTFICNVFWSKHVCTCTPILSQHPHSSHLLCCPTHRYPMLSYSLDLSLNAFTTPNGLTTRSQFISTLMEKDEFTLISNLVGASPVLPFFLPNRTMPIGSDVHQHLLTSLCLFSYGLSHLRFENQLQLTNVYFRLSQSLSTFVSGCSRFPQQKKHKTFGGKDWLS